MVEQHGNGCLKRTKWTLLSVWQICDMPVILLVSFSPSCSPLRLWWGGVTVGAVGPGSVHALPSPLHLLHFTEHRFLPGSQLPRRAGGHPRSERAGFPAKQQDPEVTPRPLLPHHHHALALLQQHLLHSAVHIPRLRSLRGAWPGGQPAPEGHRLRHLPRFGSPARLASVPLWSNQSASRHLFRPTEPPVSLLTGAWPHSLLYYQRDTLWPRSNATLTLGWTLQAYSQREHNHNVLESKVYKIQEQLQKQEQIKVEKTTLVQNYKV